MTTKDYVINNQGAKIYSDATKHEVLPIPKIKSNKEKGVVYEVLSVGMLGRDTLIATIREEGQVVAYILPEQYKGWVSHSLLVSKHLGESIFPEKVEFGCIEKENHYYAEML
ncbi:hypothetical protein ACQKOD_06105 [Bacillus mycoides]|uniref:hypothetical protein n=1 Tax=Bacillus mycoides TaxID=1405 RepID=UPI003CFC4E71